jgi:primosomal protein N' (replication factor Y)
MKPATLSVALNRPLRTAYTYRVPPQIEGDFPIGALVEVPLGTAKEIGCVVAQEPPVERGLLHFRDVVRRVAGDFLITPEIMELARWVAGYYCCSHGEALAAASVVGFSDLDAKARTVWRVSSENPAKLTTKQADALAALRGSDEAEFTTLTAVAAAAGCTPAVARKLADAGGLDEVELAPLPTHSIPPPEVPPTLSDEQQVAYDAVREALLAPRYETFLLFGATGTGKTEIYLRLIADALAEGGTALCLVPEIALTPQTVERFARRFQQEIGVFHSQMTKQEKRNIWAKIRSGEIRIVIGARSACFAPLPNLRVLIVDEEHEGTYKQGETPRYHARDVLAVRAQRLGVPLLLGSATPSIESFDNAQRGKYHLLRLAKRPSGFALPVVRTIAMGRDAITPAEGGFTLFSQELQEAIRARLAAGEQTILFMNRRGFSNFLMCSACRWVARCAEDDIVLTVHRRRGGREETVAEEQELALFPKALARDQASLKCHYCGERHSYPTRCPECGSEELIAFGSGTQRIEEGIARLFPQARILRMDQDTITTRQVFLKAWQEMVSGEAQIILGTQMIAKGLHLERVTLVGVILADIGMFIPDFRAEERVFSLLMQVAGRAGRERPGEVIFQTYMPDHPAIRLAAAHDYEGFFRSEMERRRRLRFPPVEKLTALTISDNDLERSVREARQLAVILRRRGHQLSNASTVLGPQSAPVSRLAGRFRQRILLRSASARANAELLSRSLADEQWNPPASVRLSIDVDPKDLM